MELIKSLETPGEREKSEEERIKREVSRDIEMEMEVHKDEPFHNEKHPKNVGADALRIVEIFEAYSNQVTPDTRLAAKTAADIHDLIVDFAIAQDPKAFNYGQRIRFRGFGELMPDNVKKILLEKGGTKGNEEKSWEKGKEIIKKYDPEGLVYNNQVIEDIKEGVAATYPDAKMEILPEENVTALHFSQPLLTKDSKISTLAVAFGDIMYGGKVDFLKFKKYGNEEFRELHELIRKDILSDIDNLAPERKVEIAKTALGWISTQVGFLTWQKIEFNNRLENFKAIEESRDSEALKKALRDEYSMFDSNIIDSVKRLENAKYKWSNLTQKETFDIDPQAETKFRELLAEMGF